MARGTWQGSGTWTSGGGGGRGLGELLALAGVVIIGAGVVGGVAQAVASVMTVLLVAVAVIAVLVTAGLVALVVYRVRRSHRAPSAPPPALVWRQRGAELPAAVRPSIEAPRPHVVNNFFGVTPEEVAEVLRRQDRPGNPGN